MKLKKVISVGMAVALLISSTTIHSTYATENNKNNNQATGGNLTEAEISNKSEVVYAKLSASGTVNSVYVVNHYKVVKGGTITDYGSYDSVKNLSDSKEIIVDGDKISLQAETGDFYYQGNLEVMDLPWNIELSYELNGQEVAPQDIAGKSGDLGIRIKSTRNDKVNAVFYENYMLQISLTLPSDTSSNINAPDATIAEAGNNTMIAFTVLPETEAEFKVAAKVTDFEMSGIEISAMPFSMSVELPDTDGMIKDLEKLPEAIDELNDGVGELAKGTTQLKKGADKLKDGSGEFESGLAELTKNSTSITGASAQINKALSTISKSIKGGTAEADLGSMAQLPVALSELSKGLKGISGGLKQLKDGYSGAYTALDATILGIPDTAITMDQINQQFPDADKEQRTLLNQLYASYVAGQTVKGTYTQVKQAFASVAPTLENVTVNIDNIAGALDEMSKQIASSMSDMDITAQLTQLSEGLNELANNYSEFDIGLKNYMNGVATLSSGYQQFDSGLTEFVIGVADMNSGVSELYDGTNTMNKEISKLPDQMQKEIDTLTKDYTGSDFKATSFISSKNTNTGLVQFVMKCEEIKLPEEDNATSGDTEEEKETVIDRFLALFKKEN